MVPGQKLSRHKIPGESDTWIPYMTKRFGQTTPRSNDNDDSGNESDCLEVAALYEEIPQWNPNLTTAKIKSLSACNKNDNIFRNPNPTTPEATTPRYLCVLEDGGKTPAETQPVDTVKFVPMSRDTKIPHCDCLWLGRQGQPSPPTATRCGCRIWP